MMAYPSLFPIAANQTEVQLRTTLANIEVEQALLGSILINNDAYHKISDQLKPEHFYEGLHKKIYELLSRLIQQGKSADAKIMRAFFPPDAKVGEVTISDYLVRLSFEAITIINVNDYARIIHEMYLRRQLVEVGQNIVNTSYEQDLDLSPIEQVEQAEQALFNLVEHGNSHNNKPIPIVEAMTEAILMAKAAYERKGSLSGISTGITDLDQKMGGLQNSDLIILAGRPGMGKTSLATNIAFNIAHAHHKNDKNKTINGGVVGFFSLEMSSEQLATRIISEQAEIASSKIRRGDLNQADFDKLSSCANHLSRLPFYIDQTGGISIAQLAARARRLKRQHGLDVLVIDYIQLMTGMKKKDSQNRVQEITEITTGLKSLAKELNVPIIALSQLSRQVENRDDKRPQLSDLRESGSIEQDADVVLFVYREEYYVQNAEPKEESPDYLKWKEKLDSVKGKAEIIIAKQRHGPTGSVKLGFQSQYTRFSNYIEDKRLPAHY